MARIASMKDWDMSYSWFEPFCLFVELIVKDNMCQQNHEDVVMIKDHDIDYLD